jgi:hypothetical protein
MGEIQMNDLRNKKADTRPTINESWQGLATQRGLERATDKVTGTIEKTVGKISSDIQKNTDRVTAAVKDNTEKVVDSVKKIATANCNQSVPTASTLPDTLKRTAISLTQIGDYIIGTNPTDVTAAIEGAQAITEKLNEVLTAAATVCASGATLEEKMSATSQGADWVTEKYGGGVPDNEIVAAQKFEKPSYTPIGVTTLPGTVSNTVAVPIRSVGSFNDLPGAW